MTTIETKDYKITRNSFWKFWQIDQIEFTLPTIYEDAYKEVEKKTISGHIYSMELESWVIEDIREQLANRVFAYQNLVRKAKKSSVNFSTSEYNHSFTDSMNFYIQGENIYFDSDLSIKREKLLSKLGI